MGRNQWRQMQTLTPAMKNKQLVKKAVWQKGCCAAKTKWQSEGVLTILQATLLLGSHLYACQSICINIGTGFYWEMVPSLAHRQRTVFNSTNSTGIADLVLLLHRMHSPFREISCCVNLSDLRTSIK